MWRMGVKRQIEKRKQFMAKNRSFKGPVTPVFRPSKFNNMISWLQWSHCKCWIPSQENFVGNGFIIALYKLALFTTKSYATLARARKLRMKDGLIVYCVIVHPTSPKNQVERLLHSSHAMALRFHPSTLTFLSIFILSVKNRLSTAQCNCQTADGAIMSDMIFRQNWGRKTKCFSVL